MRRVLIICIFITTSLNAQNRDTLKMLFLGDIMQHKEQLEAAFNPKSGTYDYSQYFKQLKSYFEKADIVGANIETTFPPAPFAGYPAFRSPFSLAAECAGSGINLMFAANNHSADAGGAGLKGSIETYETLRVPWTGIFRSQSHEEELTPCIIEKKGFRIAFINYTYGTNGIRTPFPYIIKRLSSEQIERDIAMARSKSPHLIFAAVHWGDEFTEEPVDYQLKWEKELYSKGVDVIVGSHPHVPQDMIVYRDSTGRVLRVTAYSLGNAISNMTAKNTRIGIMLGISVTKDENGDVVICEPEKHLIWTIRPTLKGGNYSILPVKDYLSDFPENGKLREHDLILHYYKKFKQE